MIEKLTQDNYEAYLRKKLASWRKAIRHGGGVTSLENDVVQIVKFLLKTHKVVNG